MARNRLIPSPGLIASGGVGSLQRDGVIYPSALYPVATYTQVFDSPDVTGLRLYMDITVVNGGSLTVKVQTKDPASGNWLDIAGAVTTALAAVATTRLTIYPGITPVTNFDVSTPLGVQWRISMTVATATMTFSVGGEYLQYT